ncbi:MAG: RNase adapter RapZ [Elusimicrobiota bacterium]
MTSFFIITGISGAGKSQAIKCFEDLGFFCIDNLPVALLPKFGEICQQSGGQLKKAALGIDIREGKFLDKLLGSLKILPSSGIDYRIIFLEASTPALVRRFSETRRRHPLGKNILDGIRSERKKLLEIKSRADRIIDTTNLTLAQLKDVLSNIVNDAAPRKMQVSVVSFGYKYGLPMDADLVLDVRFLPNPNYRPELKKLNGNNRPVKDYLFKETITKKFLNKLFELLHLLLPQWKKEGKSYLTVAVGCTGGRHRSVVIANALSEFLEKEKLPVTINHRDINKKNG